MIAFFNLNFSQPKNFTVIIFNIFEINLMFVIKKLMNKIDRKNNFNYYIITKLRFYLSKNFQIHIITRCG
jgi:hypothetical protein